DHTYALSSCPFALKEGYIKEKDKVGQLRDKNLMTEELSQRVGLYAGLTGRESGYVSPGGPLNPPQPGLIRTQDG
ncbi:unnamed protein product, partial [Arctogadus glacialis]